MREPWQEHANSMLKDPGQDFSPEHFCFKAQLLNCAAYLSDREIQTVWYHNKKKEENLVFCVAWSKSRLNLPKGEMIIKKTQKFPEWLN